VLAEQVGATYPVIFEVEGEVIGLPPDGVIVTE
jgi:hypothetical protein